MEYRYDNRNDYDLKEACREYGFVACKSFWEQSNYTLLDIWNGVGAEGDFINPFIPETMYGLNVSLMSLPHDWAFFIGKTKREYHFANSDMFLNGNLIIFKHSDYWFSKQARVLRNCKYYLGVESDSGWKAFCAGKSCIENYE